MDKNEIAQVGDEVAKQVEKVRPVLKRISWFVKLFVQYCGDGKFEVFVTPRFASNDSTDLIKRYKTTQHVNIMNGNGNSYIDLIGDDIVTAAQHAKKYYYHAPKYFI